MTDFSALTERQRAVWGAGNWPEVAPTIADVSSLVVEHLGVGPDHDYLDVATGSGTAAILGAKRGARTTGLDFVAKLLVAAEALAQAEGVEVNWVEGDAQDLPFDGGSFDRVSSIFGAMFAPDQERAASELVRVCRPDGVIAVAAWTPEGVNGQMFGVLGKHLPPPPDGFKPPVLWGMEERVNELFAGHKVHTQRERVEFEDESIDAWIEFAEHNLGPLVMTKAALEPEGKWEAARADLVSLYSKYNEADDGSARVRAEYLLTTVRPG